MATRRDLTLTMTIDEVAGTFSVSFMSHVEHTDAGTNRQFSAKDRTDLAFSELSQDSKDKGAAFLDALRSDKDVKNPLIRQNP